MNRQNRPMLLWGYESVLAVLSVLLLAAPCWASTKPNVLFIAIDDLNDWVGCLGGNSQVKTPHIDRLAIRGLLFTNAHCQAPICNPSRVSVMTGVLPSNSGVYDLSQPIHLAPALRNAVTLPLLFRSNGYIVMGVGKIFHANQYASQWTVFKNVPRSRRPTKGGVPVSTIPNIRIRDFGPIDMDDAEMGDRRMVDWAAERLKVKHKQPFFLAVGLRLPHVPLYAPRKYFAMYPPEKVKLPPIKRDDLADLPPAALRITKYMDDTPLNHKAILATKNWHKAVAAYLACTTFVDDCVGRLLDALAKSEHAENTIIILWSDHGWHLGEKQLWAKRSLWERSTRVPLIIAGPGVKTGLACSRPVGLVSLYPTLVELCGLPQPPQKLDGPSLTALLCNPDAKWKHIALTTFHRNDHAVRDEHWRYIRYADGSEELYDHRNDPNEWTNLARIEKYAPIKKRLASRLPTVNADDAPRAGAKKK